MAGSDDEKGTVHADKAAEKAYEAAASSATEKTSAEKPSEGGKGAAPQPTLKAEAVTAPKVDPVPEVKPVAPAKAVPAAKAAPAPKQSAKPAAAPKPKAPATPVAAAPVKAPLASQAKPVAKAPKPSAAPAAAAKPQPVLAKPVPAKPVAVEAKPAAAPAKPVAAVAKPVPAKPEPTVFKAAKTAKVQSPFAGLFSNFMLEEQKMDMSANFNGIQEAVTEAQAKAKAAFEKSTAVLGEVSDFAKGNVEAVMESGKILAEGMQGIGSELVAEGRSAFETVSGDIKELAAAKSPTDFFKIQGDMLRKNFDSAVAYGSKNSEAMLKLMSDVAAPISGRVSLAMEKARQVSF